MSWWLRKLISTKSNRKIVAAHFSHLCSSQQMNFIYNIFLVFVSPFFSLHFFPLDLVLFSVLIHRSILYKEPMMHNSTPNNAESTQHLTHSLNAQSSYLSLTLSLQGGLLCRNANAEANGAAAMKGEINIKIEWWMVESRCGIVFNNHAFEQNCTQ